MTTDNDKQHVSDAYRKVAKETTPAALDRRILDLAARESRSSYGLVRAWIRPVAWAATIGLSLAILLEMTWFIDVGVEPQPTAPLTLEERARRDADVMKAKENELPAHGVATQVQTDVAATPEAAMPDDAASAAAADSFAAKPTLRQEAPALAEAEEASPLREAIRGSDIIETAPAELRSAVSLDATRAPKSFCDDEARTSADSWYECVEALRERGLDAEAATELEALRGTFPDFQAPYVE
jgi:hypothetical protein